MADLAAVPELTFVHILFFVTGRTTGRCLVFIQMALVAALASHRPMCVAQDVFRVAVMIEHTMFPALGDVARFTPVPILPFVHVVFLVAGKTGCRGFTFC